MRKSNPVTSAITKEVIKITLYVFLFFQSTKNALIPVETISSDISSPSDNSIYISTTPRLFLLQELHTQSF
jgi:hypothetical protein